MRVPPQRQYDRSHRVVLDRYADDVGRQRCRGGEVAFGDRYVDHRDAGNISARWRSRKPSANSPATTTRRQARRRFLLEKVRYSVHRPDRKMRARRGTPQMSYVACVRTCHRLAQPAVDFEVGRKQPIVGIQHQRGWGGRRERRRQGQEPQCKQERAEARKMSPTRVSNSWLLRLRVHAMFDRACWVQGGMIAPRLRSARFVEPTLPRVETAPAREDHGLLRESHARSGLGQSTKSPMAAFPEPDRQQRVGTCPPACYPAAIMAFRNLDPEELPDPRAERSAPVRTAANGPSRA